MCLAFEWCGDNATQHFASIGDVSQMYTATRVTILALALVVASAAAVQAQNNASINVTAAVQQPITVTAASPLDFGTVFPGVPRGSLSAVGAPAASPSPGRPARR